MRRETSSNEDFGSPMKVRGDADHLRRLLETELKSDRWRIGERLPTERELGERYGMARNTVRRALDALEESNLIVRHVGRGTYKIGVPNDGAGNVPIGLPDADVLSPADVMECRLLFEPGLATLAVARAKQSDFDRMDECIHNSEAAASVKEFELWDAALHDAIAAASRNEALISVARSLARVRLQAEWGTLKSNRMTPERRERVQSEHRGIVAALRARDKELARERLRSHILHVQAFMFDE